jgi:hypothetical protein
MPGLERLVQGVRYQLNGLDNVSQMRGDALGGRRGVVQFMRETGGHRPQSGQLFLLSARSFEIAKARRHGPKNLRGNRGTKPQQAPEPFLGENDEMAIALGSGCENVKHPEEQGNLA